jgi:pimeloyl-ACP methyl ester carboxylesterase
MQGTVDLVTASVAVRVQFALSVRPLRYNISVSLYRLFCQNGPECPLLEKARQDPGDNRSQQHSALFIHTTKEALFSEAAESQATSCVNAPALTPAIPHVRYCWAIDEPAPMTDTLPDYLRVGRGRTAVVLVHGFRSRYHRFIAAADYLRFRMTGEVSVLPGTYSSPPPHSPPASIVVGFLWPCHLRSLAYGKSRDKAMEAAPRLRAVVDTLCHAGFSVVVVGHSMGCRVALRALSISSDATAPVPAVTSLVLLGAAVESECMGPDAEFPLQKLNARRVVVCHSHNDDTLGTLFSAAETVFAASPNCVALGKTGIRVVNPVGSLPELVCVDVSASVPAHHINAWLASPAVMSQITGNTLAATPAFISDHTDDDFDLDDD